jgi:catechol 2,3-dioxygenase-like lactoylglutathione lyase family enzyme
MNRVIGVDHVGIGVRSMETMRLFYRNVLGFTRIFAEHSGILFSQL